MCLIVLVLSYSNIHKNMLHQLLNMIVDVPRRSRTAKQEVSFIVVFVSNLISSNTNCDLLVLVVKNKEGEWMLPGGDINPTEVLEYSAVRKFREATGFVIQNVVHHVKRKHVHLFYAFIQVPENENYRKAIFGTRINKDEIVDYGFVMALKDPNRHMNVTSFNGTIKSEVFGGTVLPFGAAHRLSHNPKYHMMYDHVCAFVRIKRSKAILMVKHQYGFWMLPNQFDKMKFGFRIQPYNTFEMVTGFKPHFYAYTLEYFYEGCNRCTSANLSIPRDGTDQKNAFQKRFFKHSIQDYGFLCIADGKITWYDGEVKDATPVLETLSLIHLKNILS